MYWHFTRAAGRSLIIPQGETALYPCRVARMLLRQRVGNVWTTANTNEDVLRLDRGCFASVDVPACNGKGSDRFARTGRFRLNRQNLLSIRDDISEVTSLYRLITQIGHKEGQQQLWWQMLMCCVLPDHGTDIAHQQLMPGYSLVSADPQLGSIEVIHYGCCN